MQFADAGLDLIQETLNEDIGISERAVALSLRENP
jgi:hypothetical protein